ncbi:glycosyl hydrolase [Betaproteobacteria bacterium GR16-43]|nr:glycosyl hydrolase [Betaproteobacteria bacterium GR16-43]
MKNLIAIAVLPLLLLQCPLALARDDFDQLPEKASPEIIGRKLAQRFVTSPHMFWAQFGTLHYAEVATWYGALNVAALTKDAELKRQLINRFEPFFGPEEKFIPPATHVDHSVFGVLPLELYRQTGLVKYRVMGMAFADGQWDRPDAQGLTNQTRYWIDDMYMITALQVQAWRATGDQKYLDRTAKEMVVYLDRLQQPNGLFFHAPDAPFYWGRGNGWMAAGMTELLRALPANHPQRARILQGYRSMMASLKKYQSDSGMWLQLIDHPESWAESSSTAMFTYAMITGVKNGWLDESYGPVARKGWLALVDYINEDGAVREVCAGTGTKNDLAHYLNRPRIVGDFHGQAPVLWSVAALLRAVE